jgi:hypothetical protein
MIDDELKLIQKKVETMTLDDHEKGT